MQIRQIETGKIDKFLVTKFFPDAVCDDGKGTYHLFIPYGGDVLDPPSLDVIKVLDPEVWEASQNWIRESTRDLPTESWSADMDQPAREILELGKRMTAEIVALQAAALRTETQKIEGVLERLKLQI